MVTRPAVKKDKAAIGAALKNVFIARGVKSALYKQTGGMVQGVIEQKYRVKGHV